MKIKNYLGKMALSVAMVLALSAGAHSDDGGGDGAGGDREAQWFANHAILITNYYVGLCSKSNGNDLLAAELPGTTCSDFQALKNIIRLAAVSFAETVVGTDGLERDATNNGTDHITVSKKRWKPMKSATVNQRLRIVLHEFASLAKLESSDAYGFSSTVATELPEASPVQLLLDRVRFSSEYLLSLNNNSIKNLIRGYSQGTAEQKARVPALFGHCSITTKKDHDFLWGSSEVINLYLDGSLISSSRQFGSEEYLDVYTMLRYLLNTGKCM